MSKNAEQFEARLEPLAKIVCVIACAVGAIGVAELRLRNATLDSRAASLREDDLKLQDQAKTLQEEVEAKNALVHGVAEEIREELKKKNDLELAVADVLSRAKVLQEQQDRFNSLHADILDHLDKMADDYDFASTQAQGIVPP